MAVDKVAGGKIADAKSLAASFNTEPHLDIQGTTSVVAHIISASGTHVGTFTPQQSIDGSNWVSMNDKKVEAVSGSAMDEWVEFDDLYGLLFRFAYTATSGTGTATIKCHCKRTRGGHG
jgi:hypothetical protein